MAERLTPLDLEVRCSRLVHHVVSLDMELYSTLLFTQVYKWVPDGIVLGSNLAMDLHLKVTFKYPDPSATERTFTGPRSMFLAGYLVTSWLPINRAENLTVKELD